MFWTPPQSCTPERMDGSEYSQADLETSLHDLRWINRRLGGYRVIIRNLSRLVMTKGLIRFSILDAATGSGDIPVEIVKWSRQEGFHVSILGVDKNMRTIEIARQKAKDFPEIQFETGDFFDWDPSKHSFDFCISSLFLHHLNPEEVPVFLRRMLALSRQAVLINDLIRSWIAYGGYQLISRWAGLHPMTRYDGSVSVLRSYTILQLRKMLEEVGFENYSILRHFPYRFCLILEK